jgi:hypothetical protein
MNHAVAAHHGRFDGAGIADIAFYEAIPGIERDRFQVGQISGVGQFVEIDDGIILAEAENVVDEIRADEARSASDEYFQWITT